MNEIAKLIEAKRFRIYVLRRRSSITWQSYSKSLNWQGYPNVFNVTEGMPEESSTRLKEKEEVTV
jgi:hypothetical protein